MNLLILKRHNSFKNLNNGKAKHAFALFKLIPLIFKLQQQVLKFNDICINWISPKTDVEANFLHLEN